MNPAVPSSQEILNEFFSRTVCQKATEPLKNGIEIAVYIEQEPPLTLYKRNNKIEVAATAPKTPDISFWVGKKGLLELTQSHFDDIGEIGICIIKLMLSTDSEMQLKSKVHIGSLKLLSHGYLRVLPLGGPKIMSFLASKGFANIGKIKDAISQLRG